MHALRAVDQRRLRRHLATARTVEGGRPHALPLLEDALSGAEDTPPGALREKVRGIRKSLADKMITLEKADDLAALGIDPDSNMAIALTGESIVIALPVLDREKFAQTFLKLTGEPLVLDDSPGKPAWRRFLRGGSAFVGFGADGFAVMSFDADAVERALNDQARNLAYHRSVDRLLRDFSELARTRSSSPDAWVRGKIVVRAVPVPFLPFLPLLTEVRFGLTFDERAATVRLRTTLADGRSQLLDRFLAASTAAGTRIDADLARGNSAAVVSDASLPYYARSLLTDRVLEGPTAFEARFPGVLEELRSNSHARPDEPRHFRRSQAHSGRDPGPADVAQGRRRARVPAAARHALEARQGDRDRRSTPVSRRDRPGRRASAEDRHPARQRLPDHGARRDVEAV